jgi:glycosyltransferase involved in cell wall biosynthesis
MRSVLFITQNYSPSKGGMATSCSRVIKNLRRRGVIVHVIHFHNSKNNYEVISEFNGKYASVGIYQSEEYTLNLAQLFLEAHIHEFRADLIFAFGGYLPLIWAPVVSKFFDKPLYTCIRGNDFDEFIFSKRRPILFYALENSEGALCVSQEKCNKIKALFPAIKTFYTPNGINADLWVISPPEKELLNMTPKGDKKIILIAGQLKEKKGIDFFLRNFDLYPRKNEYEVWLIGDMAEDLKLLSKDVSYAVSLFPFSDPYEMKKRYYLSDIVCLPSFYEGQPNVLLEAGACKKLIIASHIGGIIDIVENNVTAILFQPMKKNSLIDAFFEYENKLSQHHLSEMQEALYQRITTCFSEEHEITNYLNIIK